MLYWYIRIIESNLLIPALLVEILGAHTCITAYIYVSAEYKRSQIHAVMTMTLIENVGKKMRLCTRIRQKARVPVTVLLLRPLYIRNPPAGKKAAPPVRQQAHQTRRRVPATAAGQKRRKRTMSGAMTGRIGASAAVADGCWFATALLLPPRATPPAEHAWSSRRLETGKRERKKKCWLGLCWWLVHDARLW